MVPRRKDDDRERRKRTLKVTGGEGKETKMKTTDKVDLAAFEGMIYPGATPRTRAAMSSVKIGEVSTVTGTFVTPDGPRSSSSTTRS